TGLTYYCDSNDLGQCFSCTKCTGGSNNVCNSQQSNQCDLDCGAGASCDDKTANTYTCTGNIDTGGTWGSYIGLFFLACSYVAIGVFSSSVTENQIIAFIIGIVLCFLLFIGFDSISLLFTNGSFQNFVISIGIFEHYKSMSRGVIDSRDIIYFACLISFFIVITKIVIESRKW
ncbi:MAG: hypothetical protein V1783_02720, partial [Bacteroidota bacterium]